MHAIIKKCAINGWVAATQSKLTEASNLSTQHTSTVPVAPAHVVRVVTKSVAFPLGLGASRTARRATATQDRRSGRGFMHIIGVEALAQLTEVVVLEATAVAAIPVAATCEGHTNPQSVSVTPGATFIRRLDA